jgi:hypothetical protein
VAINRRNFFLYVHNTFKQLGGKPSMNGLWPIKFNARGSQNNEALLSLPTLHFTPLHSHRSSLHFTPFSLYSSLLLSSLFTPLYYHPPSLHFTHLHSPPFSSHFTPFHSSISSLSPFLKNSWLSRSNATKCRQRKLDFFYI